jgi:dTDP-4-amino-4,6-dideoxygalactose transaminase
MDFIDLGTQQKRIIDNIESNIKTVLKHGQYIMGPEIRTLERSLAAFVGVKHAISCSSGTDALLMALMAYGVGPGDAVFTTPFTFVATAEVISLLGATPVFVDIDPITYNMDPERLEMAISALREGRGGHDGGSGLIPRGIIPVDLFGLPADYNRLNAIGEKYGLFVLEDAAQSFGAEYYGKKACSLAHTGCTSFFPAKPLGCYGDGGMCFTDDDRLAGILESIRVHGKGDHKYDNVRIGINGRMDTLQAAILLAKFEIFPEEIHLRNEVANRYSQGLKGRTRVVTPLIPAGLTSVWAQYSILAENAKHRDDLMSRLQEALIPTAIYYPKPLHNQDAFKYLGYGPGDFPIADGCAERIFSLPMHPYLSVEDQERIIACLV